MDRQGTGLRHPEKETHRTSVRLTIERALLVHWRAVVFALPAGAAIGLISSSARVLKDLGQLEEARELLRQAQKELVMNRLKTALLIWTLLPVLGTTWLSAQDAADHWELEAETTLASAYMWRGIVFTDGAVLQPGASVGRSDSPFRVGFWGNLDLSDDNSKRGEFTEINFMLSASWDLGDTVSFDAGYIEFIFPDSADPGTREAYAALHYSGFLQAGLELYYDFGEADDFYALTSLGYQDSLAPRLDYALLVSFGFAGRDYAAFRAGGLEGGPFDAGARFSLDIKTARRLTLSPFLAYAQSLHTPALPKQDLSLYGGLSLSFQ